MPRRPKSNGSVDSDDIDDELFEALSSPVLAFKSPPSPPFAFSDRISKDQPLSQPSTSKDDDDEVAVLQKTIQQTYDNLINLLKRQDTLFGSTNSPRPPPPPPLPPMMRSLSLEGKSKQGRDSFGDPRLRNSEDSSPRMANNWSSPSLESKKRFPDLHGPSTSKQSLSKNDSLDFTSPMERRPPPNVHLDFSANFNKKVMNSKRMFPKQNFITSPYCELLTTNLEKDFAAIQKVFKEQNVKRSREMAEQKSKLLSQIHSASVSMCQAIRCAQDNLGKHSSATLNNSNNK